jgi:hypothetical protein
MLGFKRHLEEKLKASDDMGDWVKDFQDSDAPQFKGKSQKKRQQMAVAAKLSAERNEEVKLDEVSDKKLDAYRQKAFADQPAGDDGSDKYRKRKFGRDLAFAKQTGRAKVLATKESVEELDELKKSTIGSYVNRAADDISHIQRDITSTGTQSPDYKNLSRMRKNRKAGIATAVKKLTREEVELDQETQYEIVESYLLENNIDVDSLTEQELNELIGKAIGGAFKLGAKAVVGAARRMSTSGQADAAEKRAAAAEKKNKDRERIRKAQERLKAAQRAAST